MSAEQKGWLISVFISLAVVVLYSIDAGGIKTKIEGYVAPSKP